MAGEEVEELFVTGLDFGDFVRVGGDDFGDDGFDGSGVGGFEAHFFGEVGGVFLWVIPEGGEEVFSLAVRDGAGFDEVEDGGEFLAGDGVVSELDFFVVEEAEEVVDDPVGDFFAGGFRGGDGFFEEGAEVDV